jgi:hypothetical protein
MTGYLELKSRSGRLFYRPPSPSEPLRDYQAGYPPPRYPSQRRLRFFRPSTDDRVSASNPDRTWEELARSALLKAQDYAKILVYFWIPCTTGRPFLERAAASASLETPLVPPNHDDMSAIESARRGSIRPSSVVGGPISGMIHRPSLAENVRTASTNSNASIGSGLGIAGAGEEKPIASGNGVSLSISLAEPVLFLQGIDQSELGNQTTTMLRGSFHLRVSKSAKIKTISLAFQGRAETEWPEGWFLYDPSKTLDSC